MNELVEQIKNSTDTYRKHHCSHTQPDGQPCGSPAMRGEKFCYNHHATRRPVADPQRRQARRNSFQLQPPTTRAAIQDSLGDIILRIAANDIDPRRAGLLLYALQIATTNLNDHQKASRLSASKSEDKPTMCHPEPSAAESKDLRLQDTFEAEAFPRPEPQLRPITRQTAAALLESLARHHNVEPQDGSPEDRKPTPALETNSPPELLPTLQATTAQPTHTSSRPKRVACSGAVPVFTLRRQLANPTPRKSRQHHKEPASAAKPRMSSNCLQIVISSHKVLAPEHLA